MTYKVVELCSSDIDIIFVTCKMLSPAVYVFQTQASQSALWRGARLWSKPRYHRSPSSSQSAMKMGHSPRCVSALDHQVPYITTDTPEHEKMGHPGLTWHLDLTPRDTQLHCISHQ